MMARMTEKTRSRAQCRSAPSTDRLGGTGALAGSVTSAWSMPLQEYPIRFDYSNGRVCGVRGCQLLEDELGDLLGVAEGFEVGLEFAIQFQGLTGFEPRANNHVADMDGVGKEGVFLELIEGGIGIVVVHGPPDRSSAANFPFFHRRLTGSPAPAIAVPAPMPGLRT